MCITALVLLTISALSSPAAAAAPATSPPYYPSPWGSGSGEWADAYTKARAFVRQLTLLEKVNLTTGVGYVYWIGTPLQPTDVRIDGKASGAWARMVPSLGWASKACACRIRRLGSGSVSWRCYSDRGS